MAAVTLVLVVCVVLPMKAYAADPSSDPYVDGKLSLVACIKKGDIDFLTFLRASIWNDNMMEGIIEPWNDLLTRNQCQSLDVSMLMKKQDAIRKSIRDSFLTCQTQKLPHLKTLYHELSAEVYYVRHVVEGGVVLGLPYDINTRVFGAATEENRDILYNEMRSNYAKVGVIEPNEFDTFFLKMEAKYLDRKASYKDCSSGSWQLVAEKWDEFVKSGAGAGDAYKTASKNIKADGASLKKEFKEMAIVQLIGGDKGFTDYLGSFATANLNGQGLKEGAGEIADTLMKNLPEGGGNLNQAYLAGAVSYSDQAFETEKIQNDLIKNFSGLYGVAGDETLQLFLDNLDGRQIEALGLIEIMEQSYGPLNKVLQGTKTILDRQCPGS